MTDSQFEDIAPYDDDVFATRLAQLVDEPGLEHAVKYVMPEVDYPAFKTELLKVNNNDEFQHKVMWPFLEMLARTTTTGVTVGGLENIDRNNSYTFLTNHRDIVLDTSFLNLCFMREGMKTTEVAIGDNLLIHPWITDLVRLNKSFIVRRNLRLTKALEAARHLSAYIRHAVTDKHESVWMANREGRAKDSNDLTQEGVIKMLTLSGDGNIVDSLAELNIVPVSISYQYDPNDYLKAREFLYKRLDPNFKKSQHDDLLSMETGLLQNKGAIHFEIGKCITPAIQRLRDNTDRAGVLREVCRIIDCEIHSGYKIFPENEEALALLENKNIPSDCKFADYVENQLGRLSENEFSKEDIAYMRHMMLVMYSNPLVNKIKAKDCVVHES